MRFVAGRSAVAECHRENVAGLGRRSGRDTAGRGALARSGAVARGGVVAKGGAVAEILLKGRAIGKKMLAGGTVAELLAGCRRKALQQKRE